MDRKAGLEGATAPGRCCPAAWCRNWSRLDKGGEGREPTAGELGARIATFPSASVRRAIARRWEPAGPWRRGAAESVPRGDGKPYGYRGGQRRVIDRTDAEQSFSKGSCKHGA